MAGQLGTSRTLQETPTWAVASVCFIFISLSIFVDHLIHLLCNWLKRNRKTSLFEAVDKLKSVLILLGLMSLLLAATQRPVSKICVPTEVSYTMLPCRRSVTTKTTESISRRLSDDDDDHQHSSESHDYCESQGKTSLISEEGMNQLNYFIFVLAIMQILYSALTMALGRAKMRRWDAWEKETQTVEYQIANDPYRFRYTRQTTFARRHMNSFTKTSFVLLWIECFFRQFFHSVAKVDYFTLRHGFISAHLSTNNAFNFQKYIERSLEDDFKLVVGISPFMWLIVVIFMLVDVHGWHVYLWVSFVPLIIVLILGTKLEVIVAKMALKVSEKNNVIIGSPLVQPNDDLFWFGHPKYVLTILHLTLFMNSFELAFFVWVTWQFGITSCYHEHTAIIITRVVLAVMVQVICSYITLPLYALVTQMGSNFKRSVLEEHTVKAIRKWHAGVKQKRKHQNQIRGSHDHDHDQEDQSTSHRDHDRSSTTTTTDLSPSDHHHHNHHSRSPTFADQLACGVPTSTEIVVEHSYSIASSSTTLQRVKIENVDEQQIFSTK